MVWSKLDKFTSCKFKCRVGSSICHVPARILRFLCKNKKKDKFKCMLRPHRLSVPDLHGGILRMQKLKTHMLRTKSSVKDSSFSLKPAVGQYIVMHASPNARDFFLANFYPPGPFTCIFSKPLLSYDFFLYCLWLTLVSVWACRAK